MDGKGRYFDNFFVERLWGVQCSVKTPTSAIFKPSRSPQTYGICERFHKTILQEFYQVTFRKKLYGNMDELQKDLGIWMGYYNNERTHQGKMCCGRTPIDTLNDGK
jgi:hypothetical protein